ncbi:MAG TPA: S8 family serine peptidase [Kofleriaceae bacterium]|jgi:subtilase family serine protease
MSVRRSYAWLCAIGLGLVPSCVVDGADNHGQTDERAAKPEVRLRAPLRLDRVADGEIPTASACTNPGGMHCFAHVQATEDGHVAAGDAGDAPDGFTPADLQDAYQIPLTIDGHPTIAMIDAYGYDALEADLAIYRGQFDLPPCTVANRCLTIVNQNGDTSPLPGPPPDADDWTIETALDVDMASAACPGCKLLVVQATDDTGDGLELAQAAAAKLGASVISNSWGGPERAGQSLESFEPFFDQPVAVFVAGGDDGYDDGGQGPDYPGTSAHAIAVGGTHLERDTSTRGWKETAWSSGGSACSLSIPKPSYQTGTSCNFKATTDIAAVGDPQTGMASYDSENGGWGIVGGTSAAAPIIAAIFAATNNGGQTSGSFIMDNADKLNDITTGTNGDCGNVLCTAGTGWDGPTGYGTPNGKLLDNNTGSGSTDYGVVSGGCDAVGNRAGLAMIALIALSLALQPTRRRARG